MGQRLFTFGCSFTSYHWPTWANILGREFEFFENWGLGGAGNEFIFNSLIECNARHKLTANDTVIIMWTSVNRQDGYKQHRWNRKGCLHNISNRKFSKWYEAEINDLRGMTIRDFALISAAEQILKSIGCKFQFHSMIPLTSVAEYIKYDNEYNIDDVIELYKPTLDLIKPSVYEVISGSNWQTTALANVLYGYLFTELRQTADRKELEINYYALAGSDWPTFDDYVTGKIKNVDSAIVAEIETYNFLNRYKKLVSQKNIRFTGPDYHITPVDHLRYVQKNMSEFLVSTETVDWIYECQQKVLGNNAFLFDQHTPTRL